MTDKTYIVDFSSNSAYVVTGNVDAAIKWADSPTGQKLVSDAYILVDEEADLRAEPSRVLVGFYNAHAASPISRFSDKNAAARRTFEILEEAAQPAVIAVPAKVAKAPKKTKAKTPRQRGIVNVKPKPVGQQVPCLEGSKQALLVDLLSQGTSLWALETHLAQEGRPWDPKTIIAGFYWDVGSVKGYGVKTVLRTRQWMYDNGEEAASEIESGGDPEELVPMYYLVLPEGMKAPLPHRSRKTKKD
jgi:hypothetical protein